MRWTLWRQVRVIAPDENAEAYGEVVWSWRRDAGVKFLRSKLLRGDGGKKPAHRGEHEVSRKAIAQGMSECFRCPVCSCAPTMHNLAHETAGAARTRHSLRPRFSREAKNLHHSGKTMPRDREVMTVSCPVRCAAWSVCGMMRCRPGTQGVWGWRDGSRLCGAPLKKRCTASGTREAGR